MKPNCNCEDSIRNGDFHGIDYVICTDCELLEWQGGRSLIDLTAVVHIDLPTGKEVALGVVLDWLGEQLASHSKSGTIYKIDDSRHAEFFNFANEDLSILISGRVSIPIYEHLTSYDIRCADDEEELDTFPLLREALADYSTEEIFEATYKDLYLEMVEYMHKDALVRLGEYLGEQKFKSSPLQVEIAEMFIVNPLAESSSKPAATPKSEQKTSVKKAGKQKKASKSTMLLPEDLSDIEWEEFEDGVPDEVIAQFKNRIAELGNDLIANAIAGEEISIEIGAELLLQLVDAIVDPMRKIEILQSTLAAITETHTDWDYVPSEMLELMWKITEIVQAQQGSAELLTSSKSWLTQLNMATFPVALTAAFTLSPGMQASSESSLQSFLNCWNWNKNEATLKENNDWDVYEWTLQEVAPLVAILCLTSKADSKVVDKLLKLTLDSVYKDFSLAFWEYLSGYLVDDREYGFWSPSEAWSRGFFVHLPESLPNISEESAFRALQFFWDNIDDLQLSNVYGEETIAPQVAGLLAANLRTPAALRGEALKYVSEHASETVEVKKPSMLGKLRNLFGKKF